MVALLTACGTQGADDPEPGTPPPTSATTTPEPTAEPTPAEPVASAELCGQVDTVLREMKQLHPDPEVLTTALDAVATGAPDELAADVADIDAPAREFVAAILEDNRFLAPTPELPVGEQLATACEPAGYELQDIPVAAATPDEVCALIEEAGGWQDPKDMDLEQIVTFFLDRALAHAPAEMEEQVRAYHGRMLPLWEDHSDETEAGVQLRVELAEDCRALGHFVIQPDGAGYEDIPQMQQD